MTYRSAMELWSCGVVEVVYEKPAEVLPPKDTDTKLSKKELKKKEVAGFEAVPIELGLNDNNISIASTG